MKRVLLLPATALLLSTLSFLGCDSDISGDPFANQPPETQLSVRDTSLTDNLDEADRLVSTVLVSWVGDDPDGFVDVFEFRFHDERFNPAPEENWTPTVRNDTLILLPIESGSKTANVVFEVRAIDNEGLTDPSPARTVFPIQNSPPFIQLRSFDLPPDTTFPIFSFAWRADDPDGFQNLNRIEVSLNDSVNYTSLPPNVEFITLQAENFGRGAPAETVDTDVFVGRGYIPGDLTVPGLRLDAMNTFFIRSVDATDTTSFVERFEWYVKGSNSRILYVNDFRKSTNLAILGLHRDILDSYLPEEVDFDIWNITEPFVTGNTGTAPRSEALPPNAVPTLERFLANYDYLYWVSSATTNRVQGNNFPLAAGVMDLFFSQGGKLMLHSPITAPLDPEITNTNPAIAVLPLDELVLVPDTLRRLSLSLNAAVTPVGALPGINQPLPEMVVQQFIIGALPFIATNISTIPLYEASYNYLTLRNETGRWPGSSLVVSISADRRVGLFTLPLINEQTAAPILTGVDGDDETPREVVRLMLESLGFPKR